MMTKHGSIIVDNNIKKKLSYAKATKRSEE